MLVRWLGTAALVILALLGRPTACPAAGDLVLYSWGQYVVPELFARFERETGIKVIHEVYAQADAPFENLSLGTARYDVIAAEDTVVARLIAQGLLQPVAGWSLSNGRNIRSPFDHPWFDPDRRYSVPSIWGTTGLAYDAAQLPDGIEESWRVFFDPPPRLAGKIVATADGAQLYAAAAVYLGIDPCTEDSRDAARIRDVLLAQKPNVAFYGANDGSEAWARMAVDLARQGKIALALATGNDARAFRQSFLPTLTYVVPREGTLLWQDAFVVPYAGPHPDNARIFLNWIMDPRNIGEFSDATGSTNAITGSEAFMDPLLAADQTAGLTPERIASFRAHKACSAAARNLADRVWAKLWPLTIR